MRPPRGLTIQRPVLTGHNRPVQPTGTGLGWFGSVECSDVEYQRLVSVRSFQKRKEDRTEPDFQALSTSAYEVVCGSSKTSSESLDGDKGVQVTTYGIPWLL